MARNVFVSAQSSLRDLPLATASMCLGRAWVHDLDVKLAEAGAAGYQGIEIFWEDLVYAAKRYDADATETSRDAILKAAEWTRQLCDQYGLEVLVLQPFMNYDGVLDEAIHKAHIEKLGLFFDVIKILGTDMIQIPTQMVEKGTTDDLGKIVADLKEVASLGMQQSPPVRFAYEAMAWGAHIDTWDTAWEIVKAVDSPNFGIVLDTYQIVGRVWGDPTSPDMRNANADQELADSLKRLAETEGLADKLFYIQFSDAEHLNPPLSPTHPFWEDDMKPRMQWSRNARLFPFEGGCLPLLDFARTIFEQLHWRGWVSMEIFSKTMSDPDPSVPRNHAQRGARSWQKMLEVLEGK